MVQKTPHLSPGKSKHVWGELPQETKAHFRQQLDSAVASSKHELGEEMRDRITTWSSDCQNQWKQERGRERSEEVELQEQTFLIHGS
jgi:hypothetical protein